LVAAASFLYAEDYSINKRLMITIVLAYVGDDVLLFMSRRIKKEIDEKFGNK
jgi:hypothetical protein